MGYKPNHFLSAQWSINELLEDVHDREGIKEKWNRARKNLRWSQKRSAAYNNKGRKANPYKVGDLVMYKTNPLSKAVDRVAAKFSNRWRGPYQIQRFLTPVTCALANPVNGEYFHRAHARQLKPFRGNLQQQFD